MLIVKRVRGVRVYRETSHISQLNSRIPQAKLRQVGHLADSPALIRGVSAELVYLAAEVLLRSHHVILYELLHVDY